MSIDWIGIAVAGLATGIAGWAGSRAAYQKTIRGMAKRIRDVEGQLAAVDSALDDNYKHLRMHLQQLNGHSHRLVAAEERMEEHEGLFGAQAITNRAFAAELRIELDSSEQERARRKRPDVVHLDCCTSADCGGECTFGAPDDQDQEQEPPR